MKNEVIIKEAFAIGVMISVVVYGFAGWLDLLVY